MPASRPRTVTRTVSRANGDQGSWAASSVRKTMPSLTGVNTVGWRRLLRLSALAVAGCAEGRGVVRAFLGRDKSGSQASFRLDNASSVFGGFDDRNACVHDDRIDRVDGHHRALGNDGSSSLLPMARRYFAGRIEVAFHWPAGRFVGLHH